MVIPSGLVLISVLREITGFLAQCFVHYMFTITSGEWV